MRRISPGALLFTGALFKGVVLCGAFLVLLSYFPSRRMPDYQDIDSRLLQKPLQSPSQALPFTARIKGKSYTIKPLADYELWGLLVSYHYSSSFGDMTHKSWEDFINVADLGVLWGNSLTDNNFHRVRFRSSDWALHSSIPPGVPFDDRSASNNHVLTDSLEIYRRLRSARRGDQIYFKGYLVEYGFEDGHKIRTSSLSREEKDGTACESVFITDFQILRRANPFWSTLHEQSRTALLAYLLLAFFYGCIRVVRRPAR